MLPRLTCGRSRFWKRGVHFIMGGICSYKQHLFSQKLPLWWRHLTTSAEDVINLENFICGVMTNFTAWILFVAYRGKLLSQRYHKWPISGPVLFQDRNVISMKFFGSNRRRRIWGNDFSSEEGWLYSQARYIWAPTASKPIPTPLFLFQILNSYTMKSHWRKSMFSIYFSGITLKERCHDFSEIRWAKKGY